MKWRRALAVAALATALPLSLGALSGPAGAAGDTSTTVVTDDASGTVTGGSVTFTATVSGADGTPTGPVVWNVTDPQSNPVNCSSGSTSLDVNGQATCTITSVAGGTYAATATYQGDSTYSGGVSNQDNATVAKATSTTGVTDSATSATTGGSFTFTATVNGVAGFTPTGTLNWTVTDPNSNPVTCSSSTTTLDSNGQATCTITNALGGTYTATANYGGDTNYTASSGSDNTATVAKATSNTAVTDTASGQVTGGSFTFTATVSGPGVRPTGTLNWTVTDPNSNPVTCSSSTTTLDSNGQATCTITNALGGTYTATANYGGDSNYTASSGSDNTAAVGEATSTTVVTDNASGQVTGGSFTFTATVSGPGVRPTGTLNWTVTDPNSNPVTCSSSTTTLDSNGKATCTITDALGGTYTATANYGGDSNYTGSSGQDNTATVAKATSNTAVTDNANGQSTGGSFTFTATVSGAHGTPTGTVVWNVTDPSSSLVSCSSSTTTLDSNGQATCTITDALGGTYTATANYSGDATYGVSLGSDNGATVAKANSTTVVTDNASGQVTGGSFTFTATVSGPGVTPTGALSWTVTDPHGHAVSCPSSQLTSGQATCAVTNAIAGTYSAIADYGGDSNYHSSSGQHGTAIGQATLSVGTVVFDAHTSAAWTDMELTHAKSEDTSTVTGATGITPTGSVTYTLFTNGSCSSPGTSAGTFMLSGGNAPNSNTSAALNAGSYSYEATYNGDVNYLVSTGPCEPFTVAQNTAPGAPSIANLPGAGQAVYGGSFAPAVNTETDGAPSTTSSTASVCVATGSAVSFVGVGTCTLTAHTAGTPNYTESDGSPQSFSVGQATPSSPVITNIPTDAIEFSGFTASVFTNGDGVTSVASISTAVCTVGADGHAVSFVGFGVCTLTASVAQGVNYLAATGSTESFPVGPAARGYWLVGSDGGIFSFGGATFYGSMGGTPLQRPVVGITPSASRTGYWLVASDGGIFSFGSSSYYGSIPALGLHPAGSGLPNRLNAPIVAMVPSVTGHGYFMVASDGGVFAFGDAHFAGSCPGIGGCAGKAVSVMPDATGMGYWLVTNVGAVYAFGDAAFYGSPPATTVAVVDAVATPDWQGYWLLYANGVVAGFGDATSMGAPLGYVNSFNPASAIFPTADGRGYWVAAARGDVFAYGDAPYLGSMAAAGLNGNIIAAFGF